MSRAYYSAMLLKDMCKLKLQKHSKKNDPSYNPCVKLWERKNTLLPPTVDDI